MRHHASARRALSRRVNSMHSCAVACQTDPNRQSARNMLIAFAVCIPRRTTAPEKVRWPCAPYERARLIPVGRLRAEMAWPIRRHISRGENNGNRPLIAGRLHVMISQRALTPKYARARRVVPCAPARRLAFHQRRRAAQSSVALSSSSK